MDRRVMASGPRIYNLFPLLAGPIDAWSDHLDRVARMNFDWVYVNPFHEPGFSGSLYAVKDYERLNPLLLKPGVPAEASLVAEAALVRSFVESAQQRGLNVMMDLVVNHTSKDAHFVEAHPDWYARDESGDVRSPFALDPSDTTRRTVWGDLAELDWSERPARDGMLDAFRAIVRRYATLGVRGFRCDAAYKVPGDVWRQLIDAARAIVPDAVFAAETLGAPPAEVEQLAVAGFDYLFNSSKWWDFRAPWLLDQYEAFRHIAPSIAFPESHDTPRLAAEFPTEALGTIEAAYRFHYLFAAVFSAGVMLPMGYEYGFVKALDVVATRPEDWEQPRFDLVDYIAAVNKLKASVETLNEEGPQTQLNPPDALPVALLREGVRTRERLLVLLNPSSEDVRFDRSAIGAALGGVTFRDRTPSPEPLRQAAGDQGVLAPFEARVFVAEAGPNADDPPATGTPASGGRVAVERITPSLDGGRFAVKRTAGDALTVEADVFLDGHDVPAAVVKFRRRGTAAWSERVMEAIGNDRRRAHFRLVQPGTYEYIVEAWVDAYASWQNDARTKRDASQLLALDLIEGRALFDEALIRSDGSARAPLVALARTLELAATDDARAAILLGDDLRAAVAVAPDRTRSTVSTPILRVEVDRRKAQFSAWYEFFPRSQGDQAGVPANFREAERRLADVRAMGFDVLYLPPIHPIGTTARKGRNNALVAEPTDPGSPYAIGAPAGGHKAVEPALGTLDDFTHFVEAARSEGLEIALDYALQCSPDHPYVREHPEWFVFRADGSIKHAENPPKKYEDIVNFNFWGPHAAALWEELRDVVLFWIERGVRIFRVDNPHTKPFPFWEWMIADVRSRHPDAIFLAEAFTRPAVMKRLAKLGFSQSYTYFTWRNDRDELAGYLDELTKTEMAEYFRPNFFANTPDILPVFLQSGGRAGFLIRFTLAATLGSSYGIYSGFELCEAAALPGREEYLDSEKYEVRVRDWDAAGNIKAEIATINRLRREHPSLQDWRNVEFHACDDPNVIVYSKVSGDDALLVAVNLDPFAARKTRFAVPLERFGYGPRERFMVDDLLRETRAFWRGATRTIELDPAHPAALYRVTPARTAGGDGYGS